MMTDEETSHVKNNVQFVSLSVFREFFKNNTDWILQVQSDASPFLSLLNADDVFLKTEKQVV